MENCMLLRKLQVPLTTSKNIYIKLSSKFVFQISEMIYGTALNTCVSCKL